MGQTQQALKSIGLADKEVALYLAALQLGDSGITDLAKKAGLKKTTAYLIFKSLEQRGLMGSFKMKSGMKFVATRPETLLLRTEKQVEELKKIIPELRAISNQPGKKPKITYYEGKEGYLIAVEDSLKKPNITIRHIGSLNEVHRIVGERYDLEHYIPTRIKRRIRFKALYTEDTSSTMRNLNHPAQWREIKYLPKAFTARAATMVYENKVIITSSKKDLMTIVIESDDIANAEIDKFDLIWKLIGPEK